MLGAAAAVAAGLACAGGPRAASEETLNTLSAAEKDAGWKLLFDGKTTDGWRGYKKDACPAGWKAVDGALVRAAGAGDIVSKDEYGSFELTLEWKVSPGANSGIFYRVTEDEDSVWKTGVEMQVLDNAKHHDGRNPLTSAGSCYALYAPSKDVTAPVGQWNALKLVVDGNRVEHWLNGTKIVEYGIGGEDWNKRVAASKFNTLPKFGKAEKGRLALQDHGDHVEYRNIKVREIKR